MNIDILSGGSVILGKDARETLARTDDGLTHVMIGEPTSDFGWTVCGLVLSWAEDIDWTQVHATPCEGPPSCLECIVDATFIQ